MATSTIKRTANVNDVQHKYINSDSLIKPLDTSGYVDSFEVVGKNALITFRGQDRDHTVDEVFLQIPEGHRCGGDRYYAGNINGTGVIVKMQSNGNVSVWSSNPPHGRIVVQIPYMID